MLREVFYKKQKPRPQGLLGLIRVAGGTESRCQGGSHGDPPRALGWHGGGAESHMDVPGALPLIETSAGLGDSGVPGHCQEPFGCFYQPGAKAGGSAVPLGG